MRRAWGLVLLAVLVAAGCNGSNIVPKERVTADEIDELRDDRGLPMYYAGRSFSGLPLTGASGWNSGDGGAFFAYGTCELPEGEGGCPVPIQIQHFRFEPAQWEAAVRCRSRPAQRGVPTARHDGLVLFTESIVVKIYARSPTEDLQVVAALRGLNNTVEAGDPLPKPASGVERLIARVC
jgi:hypothetical protein